MTALEALDIRQPRTVTPRCRAQGPSESGDGADGSEDPVWLECPDLLTKAKKGPRGSNCFQSTFVHPKIELRSTDRIQNCPTPGQIHLATSQRLPKHAQKKIDNFTQEVEFIVKNLLIKKSRPRWVH